MTTEQRDDSREQAREILGLLVVAQRMVGQLYANGAEQRKALSGADVALQEVRLELDNYIADRLLRQADRR